MTEETLRRIEQEIKDHGKRWCKGCVQDDGWSTFLPSVYRKERRRGVSAKKLQNDYDSCHIFR